MKGMDVSAPIEQKANHLACRRRHGTVQRRTPRPIAQVNELRIGFEERGATWSTLPAAAAR